MSIRKKLHKGFSQKYGVAKLVYYENYTEIKLAIAREKQIKKWNRVWKLKTIEEFNPNWNDLYYECGGTDDMFDEFFEELKKTYIKKITLDDPEGTPRMRGNDKEGGIKRKADENK